MEKKYAMSSVQKRIYTINEIFGENTVYNIPLILKINGIIDVDRIEYTINTIVQRHEILRTSFSQTTEYFIQKVQSEISLDFVIETKPAIDIKLEADQFIRPFDLTEGPLFRLKLIKVSDQEHYLMFDFHHIIFDGGSVAVFIDEFSRLYQGEVLPEPKVQYRKYSAWQNRLSLESQKEYWLNEFSGEIPVLDLKTDEVRPQQQQFLGANLKCRIDAATSARVKALARRNGGTEFMVLLSAFMVLLSKYSRQQEVVVGTPTSGRTHADTHHMLGMFVNTLAIKGDVQQDQSFAEFFHKIKEKCLKAFDHQEYQFEDLVEMVVKERDLSRNPLFDVMFVLQNNETAELKIGEAVAEVVDYSPGVSKFDLTLTVFEDQNGYQLDFEYATSLFKKETIEQMAKHYRNLLTKALEAPETKINKLEMLDKIEQDKILIDFNNTTRAYPREKTVVELFEEQVAKTPDHIAVVFEEEKLTYQELNQRANSLAARLQQEFQIKADDFVAIMAEKGLAAIIGILGIIKAGGAYVPIDPNYPKERVDYLLDDANPKVVLTYQAVLCTNRPVINLEDQRLWEEVADNPTHCNKAEDLIYCIYTSGTTGQPKGTMIIHRNVVRLVYAQNYLELNEETSVLQTGALSFDASTFEIWGPLLNGGKLCLCSREVLSDSQLLRKELEQKKINTLWLTATLYNQMVEMDNQIFNGLSYLLVGGEKLSEKHVRMLVSKDSNCHFINGYGPTESTTFATTYEIPDEFEHIPIGKPISNTQVYIMNSGELCGIGVPGELCIGGDGLGRGYLNRPELTAEKFVTNPFGDGRLYRSGDLARWLEDGNIEYLGRIDEQVKIRGFRIELGEIETKIRENLPVKEVAVVVREDQGDKFLCAYVVAGYTVNSIDVRVSLQNVLPDYMIPAYVMQIDQIPVNRSGKLDKCSLPKPVCQHMGAYAAPRNSKEMAVIRAFEAILGVERVGIRDSFFDLGGDSIKAIRVVSKLKEYGCYTSVKVIMSEKTAEKISPEINTSRPVNQAEQGEVYGLSELTPIQRDFFKAGLINPNYFNQSVLYEAAQRLDQTALEMVLSKLTEHHDLLRASYQGNQQIINKVQAGQWYALRTYQCRPDEIDRLATELQSSLDISTGPLMKAGLFRTPEKDYLLLIIHHLVVDGISWRIISEDLESSYQQAVNGNAIQLPEKSFSYKAWGEAMAEYRNRYLVRQEIPYWNQVVDQIKKGKITRDGDGQAGKQTMRVKLPENYTALLLRKCNQAYQTEINDLLLTALLRGIHKVTGQSILSVLMEGHGREDIGTGIDIQRTVGWFTSVYPVVFTCTDEGIGQEIRNTKEQLRRIPNKGIGYGVLREQGEPVLAVGEEPDITFNYLGEFGSEQQQSNQIFCQSNLPHGSDLDQNNLYGTAMSLNGGIFAGSLIMGLSFEQKEYQPVTVKKICDAFEQELKAVVEHCQQIKVTDHTASDYGENQWSDAEFKRTRDKLAVKGAVIERIYPLTDIQKSELADKIANEESAQYIIQTVMKFKHMNIEHMKTAFEAVVNKHGVFRNVIIYREVEIPRQVMLTERKPEFSYLEIAGEDEYQQIKNEDIKRGFDLEEQPLVRITMLKVNDTDYRMIFTEHHIIVDGWCLGIIYGDLIRYYQLLEAEKQIPVEQGERYENYVRYLESRDREESLNYWLDLLDGYQEQVAIVPSGTPDYGDEECIRTGFALTEEMTKKAEKLAMGLGVTVNTLVEAVWGLLLQKYNGTDDAVFAKVVSCRNAGVENMEQIVGLCANLIPMRIKTEEHDTLMTLMTKLQRQAIESGEHDWFSLVAVQQGGLLVNILESTIMMFENYYAPHVDSEAEHLSTRQQAGANMGMYLVVYFSETLNLTLEYNTSIYGREQINMILNHLKAFIEFLIDNPEIAVKKFQIINDRESGQAIFQQN